jgi:hypothetical protein
MSKIKFFIAAIPFLLFSCSKGGGDAAPVTIPPKIETPITITVVQDPGTGNILGVVGATQTINVKVNSELPTAGVSIEVTVRKDADNSTVFATSTSSIAADNNINITGLSQGVLCTATVLVTSKSTASNTKSISFKLASK